MAQEWQPTEKAWTDKNNTEKYAAYLLSSAYAERGYYGARVDIKQLGEKRLFVVDPGPIYHVREVIVRGPSEVQGSARSQDAPKPGDAYAAAKTNEWIQVLRKHPPRCYNAKSGCQQPQLLVSSKKSAKG